MRSVKNSKTHEVISFLLFPNNACLFSLPIKINDFHSAHNCLRPKAISFGLFSRFGPKIRAVGNTVILSLINKDFFNKNKSENPLQVSQENLYFSLLFWRTNLIFKNWIRILQNLLLSPYSNGLQQLFSLLIGKWRNWFCICLEMVGLQHPPSSCWVKLFPS